VGSCRFAGPGCSGPFEVFGEHCPWVPVQAAEPGTWRNHISPSERQGSPSVARLNGSEPEVRSSLASLSNPARSCLWPVSLEPHLNIQFHKHVPNCSPMNCCTTDATIIERRREHSVKAGASAFWSRPLVRFCCRHSHAEIVEPRRFLCPFNSLPIPPPLAMWRLSCSFPLLNKTRSLAKGGSCMWQEEEQHLRCNSPVAG
jgi:hypothetical protein